MTVNSNGGWRGAPSPGAPSAPLVAPRGVDAAPSITQPHAARPSAADRPLAGRYRLGGLLGRGGMAEVYQARDEVLGRQVAVKVFRPDTAIPEEEARQRAEVTLLASLTHPGLVAVYDAGTDSTEPTNPRSYLVLELISGPTLAQHLTHGRMAAASVAEMAAQLAEALGYVHSRHVVHRDVKPANVLLSYASHRPGELTAKLTDFGIARLLDSTHVTSYGMTVGTANYLSPEQAQGLELTVASDVYSLGLVLLESLTGNRVYPGHGVTAALTRLHRRPDIPRWLDPQWGTVLAAMTDDDPSARPAAEHIAKRFRALAREWDSTTATFGAPPEVSGDPAETAADQPRTRRLPAPTRPHHPRWRRGLLLTGAGLAAISTVIVIGLTGGTQATGPSGPARTYPSVSGQLGRDLSTLQTSVRP